MLEYLSLRRMSRHRPTHRHRPKRSNETYLSPFRISGFSSAQMRSSAIQRDGTVRTTVDARPRIRRGASSALFNERRWSYSAATTTVVQRSKRYALQSKRLRQTKCSSTGFATITIYRRRGSKTSRPYFMSRVSELRTASLGQRNRRAAVPPNRLDLTAGAVRLRL